MESRLDHFDIWIRVYLRVFFFADGSAEGQTERCGSMFSLDDSDLLDFCSISHCCNVMRCESQGHFVSAYVCVCFMFLHVCIALLLCLPIPVCVCVLEHLCLCVVS